MNKPLNFTAFALLSACMLLSIPALGSTIFTADADGIAASYRVSHNGNNDGFTSGFSFNTTVDIDSPALTLTYDAYTIAANYFQINFIDTINVDLVNTVDIETTLDITAYSVGLANEVGPLTLTPLSGGLFAIEEIQFTDYAFANFNPLLLTGNYIITGPTESISGSFAFSYDPGFDPFRYQLDANGFSDSVSLVPAIRPGGNLAAQFSSGDNLIYQGLIDGATYEASLNKITFNTGAISLQAVPVPAAIWLFGSGLLGLIGVARRKK